MRSHGVVDVLRASSRFSSNGNTVEASCRDWSCLKRDGLVVPFDADKIRGALRRCFGSLVEAPGAPSDGCGVVYDENDVEAVTWAAVNALAARKPSSVTASVEDVQRVVIQQLWAFGYFDAAERYQNYREQRRQARKSCPVSPDVIERIKADQAHFATPLQYYQFVSKFARWREEDRRRETWRETCDRVFRWMRRLPLVSGRLSEGEWVELDQALFSFAAAPAMRVVQMAGPALERCEIGVYNCAYAPLEDLFSLPELFYVLMQGTGQGYSVESEYVEKWPRVKKQSGRKPDTVVVDDSTEGWCDGLHTGIQRWIDGHDVEFDTSCIRPAGARLKIKGGRAAGPRPFTEAIAFIREKILSRQGRFLDDLDLHDMACVVARAVHLGGVRRAAMISLSDLLSASMRDAKAGNWFARAPYRTQSNNSGVYDFDGAVPVEVFMEEWLALVKSKSGERGIFNRKGVERHLPTRRQKGHKWGMNPCGEIVLRPYGLCNLSMAIARHDDTAESLARKVRLATIFGVIQSTCTRFRYVRDQWRKNAEEERLLGVDITGQADCPLLRYGAPGRRELIRMLTGVVASARQEFARRFGINESAADTCLKPGGDSAVLFDCSSGLSARFAHYQLRRVRESNRSPVALMLKDAGVPWAPAPEDPERLLVFEFPLRSPSGATTRNDLTAVQQLENWLEWREQWAEHSCSYTVFVEEHEWPEAGAWVYKRFDKVTGLSFMPKDNGMYACVPNEEITEAEYAERVAKFPDLNWAKLQAYEQDDATESSQNFACAGGLCSL